MKIGYFLSSEEWGPKELISQAVKAQEAGFEGLWISDHYHPWNDAQGHSSFVWATIGGISPWLVRNTAERQIFGLSYAFYYAVITAALLWYVFERRLNTTTQRGPRTG